MSADPGANNSGAIPLATSGMTPAALPAADAGVGPGPRATVIVACPDGPLLVRGEVEIRTPSGDLVPRRRRTVALCRCGATGIAPFCDGSHKAVGFRSESA